MERTIPTVIQPLTVVGTLSEIMSTLIHGLVATLLKIAMATD